MSICSVPGIIIVDVRDTKMNETQFAFVAFSGEDRQSRPKMIKPCVRCGIQKLTVLCVCVCVRVRVRVCVHVCTHVCTYTQAS